MKHFLTIKDCESGELTELLNTADQLKYEHKNNISHKLLEGKTLGMIFDGVSTRTRVSFEIGMYQLGGNAMFLPTEALQITKGEPVADTARTLSRYLDAVMIRTPSQALLEEYASLSDIPVINGATDEWHPCQVIGDLMTIREYKVSFRGIKIAYIGSGNNIANSLISACAKLGIKISMACPEGFFPSDDVIKLGTDSDTLTLTTIPAEAVKDADVVYSGIWHAPDKGYDAEARAKIFDEYTLNKALISLAASDALVLHCLPARRGEEIYADIFEAHAEQIFTQTENRLHAQKAILLKLMGNG